TRGLMVKRTRKKPYWSKLLPATSLRLPHVLPPRSPRLLSCSPSQRPRIAAPGARAGNWCPSRSEICISVG
uniref:Uncharacterized protein n=1 Tax=Aegilops tauschii subsp. strangulata TaxID=200361 RepID=A0A453NTT2_AEGTS